MALAIANTIEACLDTDPLIMADVIAVEFLGSKHMLWKRSQDEVEARGSPAELLVVTITVDSIQALRGVGAIVHRLKFLDGPEFV